MKMTKKELEEAINKDPYLQDRRTVSNYEKTILLREVGFRCPICKKDLHPSNVTKSSSHFEIAHIYPNRPTAYQYKTLFGVEKLGNTCESIENKIALCLDCHHEQDYKTSIDDYLNLLNIKKKMLHLTQLRESIENLSLDDELIEVMNMMATISGSKLEKLRYSPIPISNKIEDDNEFLKTKIKSYVDKYFIFIRDCFRDLDGKNGFQLEVISSEIKTCYLKLNEERNQNLVFELIVNWVMKETKTDDRNACEAIVSFFVQNCEVFDEIPE